LIQRWPGICISRLPPKKAIGRYETVFLKERRIFLERFLRKCGKYDFIINSEEFLIFSRPNGDIEKVFSRLNKIPTSSMIERFRTALNINESRFDLTEREMFSNQIADFLSFTSKVLPQLKIVKAKLRDLRQTK
jgi:PX domain